MNEIVVATNNRHKFDEISAILNRLPVRLIPLSDYPDAPELKEEGATYAENAVHKALIIARFTGKWALGDDTGLEVDVLDGQPGLYSARFAGGNVTFDDNKRKLLRLMESVPTEKRTAVFRTVLALVSPSGESHVVEGLLRGRIADKEQGAGGFGYDALFYLPESGRTYAELTNAEKNRISHRAHAVEKIKAYLQKSVGV
ncbi:MAG: RdgB/HAM1 family non-canonical purine NTP pyrophosphatase [Nitrospirae bacterium]|nr:RdgB/HAM1 family non-canonical purine NTP pyrophosphatase [Nitrospirota bacterium]